MQHGDGIGCGGGQGGSSIEEFAEEDLGVGERAARGGIGGDGPYRAESVRRFDDELDGANFVERGDGAAGDDGELGRKRRNGNEAKVSAGAEEFAGTERGLSVVEGVVLGKFGCEGWVFEVPHEWSGIEEVDGGDTEHVG